MVEAIAGEYNWDGNGRTIALSADRSTVVIVSSNADDNAYDSGHVQVFTSASD